MPAERKPVVAIIGAGKCSKKLRDMAAEAGKYVAEHGGVVVCGGRGGVMEGASRGAKEAGGVAIGVLPGSDKGDANEFVDYVIPTGIGEARNAVVINCADAVLAFPGKYGTLTEMAFALKSGKPLVSIHAWKLGDNIIQVDDPAEGAAKAMELAAEGLSHSSSQSQADRGSTKKAK